MKKFYLELKAFRTRSLAHKELQTFVFAHHQQVMDDSRLKRFKTDLIRKSWEVAKRYPECADLEVRFSTYNPAGTVNQLAQVRTNFRLTIKELRENVALECSTQIQS